MSLLNRFWVEAPITPVKFVKAVTTGRVAIEGRAVCNGVAGYIVAGQARCPDGPDAGALCQHSGDERGRELLFNPATRFMQ